MNQSPFHLAFPVKDLAASRAFYVDILGCELGRESERWLDFNFFGHQITAHRLDHQHETGDNPVDGKQIPVPHFGAILEWPDFFNLAESLQAKGIAFIHEPQIRFAGKVGEQATMFLADPSGNVLEFKSFKDRSQIFAK